jgi:predicted esterase
MSMMESFEDLRAALFAAHASGDYDRGLRITLRAHEACPQEHASTWYWQACMLSLLGMTGEALDALRTGLEEGVWYSPAMLDEDSDLDALRPLQAFAEVRAECARRLREKAAAARPECIVLSPASLAVRSTLVALHQRSQSARAFTRHWAPLVDVGWTLVVPESSQPFGSDTFCWDDHDLALRDIRRQLDECAGRRGISLEGMVIAGASQGAPLALEIGLEEGIPWLCAIPGFPARYRLEPGRAGLARRSRGAFLFGERDPHNGRSRAVIDDLSSAGAELREAVMAGAGHWLSPGFIGHARPLLDWLRGGRPGDACPPE